MCPGGNSSSLSEVWEMLYICAAFPHIRNIWLLYCVAQHPPSHPPRPPSVALVGAAGEEGAAQLSPGMLVALRGGWETQAGATLFFFFLGIETISNYCEEQTACPLLHVPCPLPVIWIVFGRTCLVRVGVGRNRFLSKH